MRYLSLIYKKVHGIIRLNRETSTLNEEKNVKEGDNIEVICSELKINYKEM